MISVAFIPNHTQVRGIYKLNHVPRVGEGVIFKDDQSTTCVVSDVIWHLAEDDANPEVYVFLECSEDD